MNRKIEVEFKDEPPPFVVPPVTGRDREETVLAIIRRRFWLGWQLFGRECRD